MNRAAIGPVEFEFRSAGLAMVPDTRPRFSLQSDGLAFGVFDEGQTTILVADHRTGRAETGAPARVEVWVPQQQPELNVSWLVLLADARANREDCEVVSGETMLDIVRELLALSG